jgi:MinD superfamily P-loop ATPase containing an inserted ferredoxin domain
MFVKVAIIDKKQCVACGCCVNICPKNAIAMFKGKYAVVDEELCVGCGKCSKICPASVINMEVVKND